MDSILEKIKQEIQSHPILLFMKGKRSMPVCGFSAKVVAILDEIGADYETRDVLDSEALRQGIKEYSNWPTIPQLYVKGQFIGGCDILSELHERGELRGLLGLDDSTFSPQLEP